MKLGDSRSCLQDRATGLCHSCPLRQLNAVIFVPYILFNFSCPAVEFLRAIPVFSAFLSYF